MTNVIIKFKLNNLMLRIFKHLEAGCLQVNLVSTSAQINQLNYTIVTTDNYRQLFHLPITTLTYR